MALSALQNEKKFGVGDVVDVHQRIPEEGAEPEKYRTQVFQGTVIKIGGRGNGRSMTVRRIGSQSVGVELIMPLASPLLEKIEVVKPGMRGVRQGKLYYVRNKSTKETDRIYARAKRRGLTQKKVVKPKKTAKAKKLVKVAKK